MSFSFFLSVFLLACVGYPFFAFCIVVFAWVFEE